MAPEEIVVEQEKLSGGAVAEKTSTASDKADLQSGT